MVNIFIDSVQWQPKYNDHSKSLTVFSFLYWYLICTLQFAQLGISLTLFFLIIL